MYPDRKHASHTLACRNSAKDQCSNTTHLTLSLPSLVMFSQIPFYLLFLVSLILGAEGKRGGGKKGGSSSGGSGSTNNRPIVMSGPGTRTDPNYPNIVFFGSGRSEYCRDKAT